MPDILKFVMDLESSPSPTLELSPPMFWVMDLGGGEGDDPSGVFCT